MSNYCYSCEIVNEITGETSPCECNTEWQNKLSKPQLRIVELDLDGREPNTWIVNTLGDEYSFDPPVFESEHLTECVAYCYGQGVNFEIYTLAAWYREHN